MAETFHARFPVSVSPFFRGFPARNSDLRLKISRPGADAPKHPATQEEKNLWYPGYEFRGLLKINDPGSSSLFSDLIHVKFSMF